jgi:putative transposase/transposase-like zinc-binding protein
MPTRRALFPALAPASLERDPTLPRAHRTGISAIRHGHSGHDGPRLSPCASGGEPHRVHHACGNRHCPQCQQPTTPQWLAHHREKPWPGPPFLRTCTVPETRRPFLRAPPRLASHALFPAASLALTRLAPAERCSGTDLPGFPGVLPTWGRQLQSHPHLHDLVPGGGLSADRTTGRPSRANFCVPVQALAPISRALFNEDRPQAGLLDHRAPQVWTSPWHVHRQARHHGHSACTSLAPSGFQVALSTHRLVSLTGRPVTFPSRTVGRARLRTAHRDVMELLRRCLQPGLPDGLMTVRPCGLLHASWALPLATSRLMIVQGQPSEGHPMRSVPAPPRGTWCPTCGAPMRVVMRLGTSPKVCIETS